jgi:hypothetical protein
VLDAITTQDEVQWMKDIYDRLFAQRAGRDEGNQFDLGGSDEDGKTAKPIHLSELKGQVVVIAFYPKTRTRCTAHCACSPMAMHCSSRPVPSTNDGRPASQHSRCRTPRGASISLR